MTTPHADYDNPWKEAIRAYLELCLTLFTPDLARDIDWSKGVEFLDTELRQIARESETGPRRVDLLIRVTRRNGTTLRLYIHIEIQSQPVSEFPFKMLIYFSRILDLCGGPVVSLAVLTDPGRSWRPGEYSYEEYGTRLNFDYRRVKLADYDPEKLLEEYPDNPIALVAAAHLEGQRRPDPLDRLQAKKALLRRLYKSKWERDDIKQLFRFLDWLMALTPELEKEFRKELRRLEEEMHMPYITSIERMGREEGRQEGLQAGVAALIVQQLQRKMGELPEALASRVRELPFSRLEYLGEALLNFHSLEELQDWMARTETEE